MTNNCDFYAENERFRSFIAYYSRLLKYQGADVDLWEHLYLVMLTKGNRYPDSYYFKCLKNEYIRLSRIQAENKIFIELNADTVAVDDFTKSVENRFLISFAFELLTVKEKEVLRLHYALGYSLSEVAKQRKLTRQAVNQMKQRALKKIKSYAELDKMRRK